MSTALDRTASRRVNDQHYVIKAETEAGQVAQARRHRDRRYNVVVYLYEFFFRGVAAGSTDLRWMTAKYDIEPSSLASN